MEKAEKEAARNHAALALKIKVINKALLSENVRTLTERAVKNHVHKLEEVTVLYEDSIAEIYAAAREDEAKRTTYSDMLIEQLGIVNPILDQLQDVLKNLTNPDEPSPEAANQTNKSCRPIEFKIQHVKQSLDSRIRLIQDSEKQQATPTTH